MLIPSPAPIPYLSRSAPSKRYLESFFDGKIQGLIISSVHFAVSLYKPSTMPFNDSFSEETKAQLEKNYILKRSKSKKYKKELIVEVNYNYLQYLGVVRIYLQNKYNLKFEDIELLLYLYPINYFTRKDIRRFPCSWGYKRLNRLIQEDYIVKLSSVPARTRGCVFMLSIKAKNLVRNYHELLSGEKSIPNCPQHNPIFRKDTNTYRSTARAIMEEMRELLKDQNRWE
ncbi:hypothetical protein [Urechidicola vernalis]|uniref:Uncharacterized protein n=1 Tax=Urechidicola vernalis TaxID=3075600 RepID=A0ABU2Y769_9FLAO|nr:hypothetical protein [Urechidicola sp. P050]MDT0554044.1 hypothetical protein [Urechidicola sp. P050]